MKTNRLLAASAALVVTGSAFAGTTTTYDSSLSATPLFTNADTRINFSDNASETSPAFDPGSSVNLAAGQGKSSIDNGTIWVLTDLSYEFSASDNATIELGAGWYGLGGGVNWYTGPHKDGLMWSARVGWIGNGVGVNGAINYVGNFSPNLKWRVGVGVEYDSASAGFWHSIGSVFPVVIADIGFKL